MAPPRRGMLSIAASDLTRMRAELFFDGEQRRRKLSRFWVLLVLSALIATAGVVGNATATVIGAMIVAPLMTPILGTVLSVVTRDGPNLLRSLLMVTTGALAVIAVAWLTGHLYPLPVVATSNPQVAARVSPHLIDLVAALATGAVGAFAMVREDVSDTLPGVAIAISLVPPLAVVGLTLESGARHQANGAMLLFLANVSAILVSGLIVMALYGVGAGATVPRALSVPQQRLGVLLVVLLVALVAWPLTVSTRHSNATGLETIRVASVATAWAAPRGWQITSVDPAPGGVVVRATGPLPPPRPSTLRQALNARGLSAVPVRLQLTPLQQVNLPGT
jgi:uncharacterized hydrophobic protein (TIGR00271 family)